MTIIEIQNQIHSLFLKTDTFIFPDDVKKINVDKHQICAKSDLIKKILHLFEEKKMLLSYDIGDGKTSYTLFAPLGSEGQEIAISQQTSELVAEIINQYRRANNIEAGLADKLNLGDRDIQSICLICSQLLNSMDPDNNQND
jgi:hypothetical protein